MKDIKEPEYPSLYDPRSKTGRYYPWEEEYIKKMNIWQEWYDSKGKNQLYTVLPNRFNVC